MLSLSDVVVTCGAVYGLLAAIMTVVTMLQRESNHE